MRLLSLLALALMLAACGSANRSYVPVPSIPDGSGDAVQASVVSYERPVIRGGRAAPPEAEPAVRNRQMVRNAYLLLEADDEAIPGVIERAVALAESVGGYTASQSTQEAVLRIPEDRLDEALTALATLGKEVRRDVSTVDVTAQYTDLQIRLDNARALRDRLAALLQEASGVEDVLAVERELSRVTTEVERLEGQMRLLQNQVSFSTVRLNVRQGSQPGPLGYVVVGLYEAVKWLFVWD